MTLDIQTENAGEYLLARLKGERTLINVLTAAGQIIGTCQELRLSKALVDVRGLEGELQTFDTYEVVAEKLPQSRGVSLNKAAIVDREESLNRFFEDLAVNRGMNIRLFTDEGVAVEWLTG